MSVFSYFARRRLCNGALTLVVVVAIAIVTWLYHLSLRDASFLTGWLLLTGVVLLASLNVRKKLTIVPLLNAAIWVRFHAYLGLAALALFLMHTEFHRPTGGLEITLWILFVTLVVTGIIGLFLSRVVPSRLTRNGERILFDRIPVFRAQLADRMEALANQSIGETNTDVVMRYYIYTLLPFMIDSRHFLGHICGSHRNLDRIHQELGSLHRGLGEQGKSIIENIREVVDSKSNLDFQHSWQLILKGWLFVHIPLTWVLLIISVIHVILVYSFGMDTL